MSKQSNAGGVGGSQSDPAESANPAAESGCCGTQASSTDLTVTNTGAAATEPCCGTRAEAEAQAACCGASAKAEAVAAGQGCC